MVTQLKWRLLQGGGQAYYELGVADTGSLIGLSRVDLEESLQTLEMMAGEIGASVIVVKEIEVSPALVALADKLSEYVNPDTGEWTEKMVNKRARRQGYDPDGESAASTPGLTEADIENADNDSLVVTPLDLEPGVLSSYAPRPLQSNPERPTAHSSPFIAPLDDDLALFCMDPEPPLALDLDASAVQEGDEDPDADSPTLGLEISSVYKPRPMHRRPPAPAHHHAHKAVKTKAKEKKPQPWHIPLGPSTMTAEEVARAKAIQRRVTRDLRREERRKAQLATTGLLSAGANESTAITSQPTVVVVEDSIDEVTDLGETLSQVLVVTPPDELSRTLDGRAACDAAPDILNAGSGTRDQEPGSPQTAADPLKEPRIIVEALVVRKLSIDEALLDFGGFSLT